MKQCLPPRIGEECHTGLDGPACGCWESSLVPPDLSVLVFYPSLPVAGGKAVVWLFLYIPDALRNRNSVFTLPHVSLAPPKD